MKKSLFYLFLVLNFVLPLALAADKKVYIVYFGEHDGKKSVQEIKKVHTSYLQSVKESKRDAKSSLVYSYKHSVNGFAAKLTSDEASKLSKMEKVVSVIPSRGYTTQTTRSWDFLGLNGHSSRRVQSGDDLMSNAQYGKNQILGLIDSGVWPESPSFSDEGMDPIPRSWNGICQEGPGFNKSHCNRGFYNYYGPVNPSEDYLSPRDADGHGSHTASIATGRVVKDATLPGGVAKGTASGGAPMVHLAIYKACWAIPNQPKSDGNTCRSEDLLAAIDDAIGDGVDIISISIGVSDYPPLDEDAIAIGSLHAASRNIVTVCSAGNYGPSPRTLSNTAPWIITVAASTIDRDFYSSVTLGNGAKIDGFSIAPYAIDSMYQLVYSGDVALPGVSRAVAEQCQADTLDPSMVNGKIVLCFLGGGQNLDKGIEVHRAGGAGMIIANTQNDGVLLVNYDLHFIPATGVTYDNALQIYRYISSTTNPTATIIPVQSIKKSPAPIMVDFSSRGPNHIDPYILKPDITAPGVEILAAWSEASSITKLPYDQRSVKYNLDSGTSMSCPHISGVAALLKAIHPDWSISAIKSALMTTASITDNTNNEIQDYYRNLETPFAFGAGQFDPNKAADPGLVYDSEFNDYLLYLCTISPGLLNTLNSRVNCPYESVSTLNLNYPSFAVPDLYDSVTITRTVTNVCHCSSTYKFSWQLPPGIGVAVEPTSLYFDRYGQSQSFTMTYFRTNEGTVSNQYVFGWYMWSDEQHQVRSPFAIFLP